MARRIVGSGIDLVIIADGSQLFTKERLMSNFGGLDNPEIGHFDRVQTLPSHEPVGSFF
jgi:hypothetical protein